jgi:cation/acetate symporter
VRTGVGSVGAILLGPSSRSRYGLVRHSVDLPTPGLPAPVVGLVAAGALAAALSTASGLLLVISSFVANDVYYKRINPQATEARQLLVGRIAMGAAIVDIYGNGAGIFGIPETGLRQIGS